MEIVDVKDLNQKLGFSERFTHAEDMAIADFKHWRMEVNDAPIFRYLYRNFKPNRHLEFGTWQGFGTVLCLEECSATVWTINLPFGEKTDKQELVYSNYEREIEALQSWAAQLGIPKQPFYRTDRLGFIGRHYLGRRFGHRVCQIYADSTEWDISNYPQGFFDSCLIDGAHTTEIVSNDTVKALQLVRSAGMILWHDYCPYQDIIDSSGVVRGVTQSINMNIELLRAQLETLFWVDPSMILVGVKK